MKNIKKLMVISTILSLSFINLNAHSFWVNFFESFSHKPAHIIVGLGWGHAMPMDDILNSPNGRVIVEEFKIISPNGEIINLDIPSSEPQEANKKAKNFDIFSADMGLQKIALKENSQKGVYKIEAKTQPTFYTEYIDTKGNKRLKLTTMDKLNDIQKVLMSLKFEAFAKSYLTIDKWEEQKASNKGLEIIPKTDLSNVKVGDLVEFEVLFEGKPLNVSPSSIDFISADSNTFGQNDSFSLMSYIVNGKAQFRVQSPGQWRVSCNHRDTVTKDGSFKDLFGKVEYVFNTSSLTFNVKE
ncbi:DUF4198 domain-containing protein [Aliarcobacter butzleri]|uniref:DUF4198 domain-containing protein n=1 Tax=Aliarcobacter butzleri TaxID=28197 RepID=UPI0021B405BF|nr:DUF4198 domain-containing protein [Aliarcobacter butzleri]MCT7547224.1 DUF4198 domain-containing protein [Aliarcobacter butzleri]